jgi:hypothetical protein
MLGAIANTVKATGGEGKEMVSERPPSEIMLELGFISALPQIDSSQLSSFRVWNRTVPLLSGAGAGRGGAEW